MRRSAIAAFLGRGGLAVTPLSLRLRPAGGRARVAARG